MNLNEVCFRQLQLERVNKTETSQKIEKCFKKVISHVSFIASRFPIVRFFFGLLYVKTKDITSPKCNLTYFKSCIFDGSLEDIATEDLCPMFGVDVRTPIDEDPWHVKMTMKHMFLFSVNAIWNGQLSKIECI